MEGCIFPHDLHRKVYNNVLAKGVLLAETTADRFAGKAA